MEGTITAYIGLGANVGETRIALENAVVALDALPGASLAGVSRLYQTHPVGPAAQADFLNAVVALRVPATGDPADGAMALLIALKGLEQALGREDRERWGPREIDLDLLLYGGHGLHVERDTAARSGDPARHAARWLDVPHAASAERLFVLAPLADIAPDLQPPGWDMTVALAMIRAIEREGADAVRAVADWVPAVGHWVDLGPLDIASTLSGMQGTDA